MAVGVDFEERNKHLGAPAPEEQTSVYALPVYQGRDLDGRPFVVSCWQMTPEELHAINESGGLVWFSVQGVTHAPMYLSGIKPHMPERS